ncbi:MAG: hypothetical protein FGM61_05570 [Sediminibacterium sp.]|nr:hypothetical protein [Sediminibacterium sp.]
MQKWIRKIDWILIFRLGLSTLLLISGYTQAAYTDMYFGGGLAIYSLLAAKFQWGCGYGHCAYTPPRMETQKTIEETTTSN